jgi:malate/lactate dehydrogenase
MGCLRPEDGLDSMSFGVPARIGSHGVERVYELPVDDVREALERSAAEIKQDLKIAAKTLREKYAIEV